MMVISTKVSKSESTVKDTVNSCISIAYLETLLAAPRSTGVAPYHAKYIKPLTERENPNVKK